MGLLWCSVTLNLSFRHLSASFGSSAAQGGTRGTGATHRGPVRSMGSQCWRPRQVMIWLPSIVRMLRGLEIYMWIALKRTSGRWRNMLCITHTCSKLLTLWATLLCTMPRCLEGLILWKRFWTFIVILTLFFISSLNSRDMKRSRVCCSRRREVHVLRLSLWCLGSLIRNMVVLGSGLETAWKRFAPNFQATCFRGDMPKPMHVLGQIQRWKMWFVLWRTENNWNPFLWNFDFADLPWSGFLHRTPGVILKQSQEMLESNTPDDLKENLKILRLLRKEREMLAQQVGPPHYRQRGAKGMAKGMAKGIEREAPPALPALPALSVSSPRVSKRIQVAESTPFMVTNRGFSKSNSVPIMSWSNKAIDRANWSLPR